MSSRRARRLARTVGVATVLVVGAVWAFGGTTVRTLTGGPDESDFFEGYWPVATLNEARHVQDEVDDGEGRWRRDPTEVATRYGRTLGWKKTTLEREDRSVITITPTPAMIRGSSSRGWSASLVVDTASGTYTVELVGLKGAKRPAWFVAGVRTGNITIEKPTRGSATTSPLHFEGETYSFAGSTLVTIFDDDGKVLGRKRFPVALHSPEPLRGVVPFDAPNTPGGTVRFEDSRGGRRGGFDTVIRLRFGASAAPTTPPAPDAKVIAAQRAFMCFAAARHDLDVPGARACSTQQRSNGLKATDLAGPSATRLDRATIGNSSKHADDRIVFYARSFWVRGSELVTNTEDVVTVVRETDGWKVDRWTIGEREETGTNAHVAVFLPKTSSACVDGRPDPDEFVRVERLVPAYMAYETGEHTAVRELVTGPWPHEPAAMAPFPAPARVEDVEFIRTELLVTVRDRPRASGGCDVALESLTRTIRALGIRSKVRIVDPSDAR